MEAYNNALCLGSLRLQPLTSVPPTSRFEVLSVSVLPCHLTPTELYKYEMLALGGQEGS